MAEACKSKCGTVKSTWELAFQVSQVFQLTNQAFTLQIRCPYENIDKFIRIDLNFIPYFNLYIFKLKHF